MSISVVWAIGLCTFFSDIYSVHGSLTPDFTTTPCPGELISLTCTAPGLDTIWSVPGEPNLAISSVNTEPVVCDQYTVEVVSVDEPGNMLTSRLSTPAVEGLSIGCDGLQGLPGEPFSVVHMYQSSSAEGASVSVGWNPPTDNGGRDDLNYTVTISPPAQLSATVVTSTFVSVSAADYNVDYTVSVVATNCAGNSSITAYNFSIANCSQPSLNPGVELDSSVSSTIEGATITYSCPGLTSTVSTCVASGRWSPDPSLLVCPTPAPPVMCGPPSPPANGSIVGGVANSSSVDTVIMYRCDAGLFPPEDLSSVCGSNGVWSPNPGEIVCSNVSFTCSLPAPLTGGFVVKISNSSVVFGCREGFSPEENKTANCVAMNQWRPSPQQLVCELIGDTVEQCDSTNATSVVAVGATLAVLLVVFTILGFLAGLLVMYLITRKKTVSSPSEEAQPTAAPAGPVYEQISPSQKVAQEIELKSNQAYGPVGH